MYIMHTVHASRSQSHFYTSKSCSTVIFEKCKTTDSEGNSNYHKELSLMIMTLMIVIAVLFIILILSMVLDFSAIDLYF